MADLDPEVQLARRAKRQHGVFTLADVKELGFKPDQITYRVRKRRWEPLCRNVWVTAGTEVTAVSLIHAACLACPVDAAASHYSTAVLLGLLEVPPERPTITVPVGSYTRSPLARVYRRPLPEEDRTRIGRVPSTTPSRMFVDLASVMEREPFESLLDDALIRKVVFLWRVKKSIERRPPGRGQAGRARLLAALEPWEAGIAFESPMEVRLFRRLVEWGFPRPTGQHQVLGPRGEKVGRIDLAWPERLVGLEYIGELAHAPRHAGHDEQRIARLEALGWTIEEVDKRDLRPSSTRLRRRLAGLLGPPG
jgi:hypothetical protein